MFHGFLRRHAQLAQGKAALTGLADALKKAAAVRVEDERGCRFLGGVQPPRANPAQRAERLISHCRSKRIRPHGLSEHDQSRPLLQAACTGVRNRFAEPGARIAPLRGPDGTGRLQSSLSSGAPDGRHRAGSTPYSSNRLAQRYCGAAARREALSQSLDRYHPSTTGRTMIDEIDHGERECIGGADRRTMRPLECKYIREAIGRWTIRWGRKSCAGDGQSCSRWKTTSPAAPPTFAIVIRCEAKGCRLRVRASRP